MDEAQHARAAGWQWLATLPRSVTAHADRGDDPLTAVRGLLSALDDPQRHLRVVHIAGSKGKGSTALYVEALLERLGHRTLTFTSPHLIRWTERIRLGGAEAPAPAALAALEAVQRAGAETAITPGFFEALTVAALWLARQQRVDWVVLEAGVGGRADATNVVEPAICALTAIEREHTDRLGSTLEAITREKAGIIKPGVPILAPTLPEALATIVSDAANRVGAERLAVAPAHGPVRSVADTGAVRWHRAGDRLTAAGPGWRVATRIEAPGPHNGANTAMALGLVARLGITSAERLQTAARALAETPLPGRNECVSRVPWVIVDAAHTDASARALTTTVAELRPSRVHLLLSISSSKEVAHVVEPLLPWVDSVTATQANPDYSLRASTLAERVRGLGVDAPVIALEDSEEALAAACADRPGETLVLATGSVYLAGQVRAAFDPANQGAAS
jgi:dihydrofolate synthase/folylpolyglutamate synthase